MSVEVMPGPEFKTGVPKVLWDAPALIGIGNGIGNAAQINRWDISADGQRFLFVTNPQGESSSNAINVVLNWEAALKKP